MAIKLPGVVKYPSKLWNTINVNEHKKGGHKEASLTGQDNK